MGRARPAARGAASSIEAISGTSAGAMNAAVMAAGHAGRQCGARARSSDLAQGFEAATFSPLQRSPLDVLLGRWSLDHSPAYPGFRPDGRVFSPHDLGIGGPTRWKRVLARSIDFACANAPHRSFSSPRPTCGPDGRGIFAMPNLAECTAGVGLPSVDVSGRGDRRRGLPGWRLFRQSDDDTTGPGVRLERHHPGGHQVERPGVPKIGARHPRQTG